MQKLMARQVGGRDLPQFSGRPEEWPVFAHMFKLTTAECGLSDSENLIRLQKCLRGDAREAVLAMLTVPGNVGEVMRTLELRFGRPDLVVSALISKAKSLGNLKPGDFESLIAFSTSVRLL